MNPESPLKKGTVPVGSIDFATQVCSPERDSPLFLRAPRRGIRIGFLLALLISCVGCDQVTKKIATRALADEAGPHSFLGDTFRLQFARNPGAFLGMGGNLPPEARFWTLTVINAIAMVVIGIVMWKRWNMAPVKFVAGSLLLAGGIGNLIDRVRYEGLVTDFLNLGIGPVRTGIFNVADMAITAGCCILFVAFWRDERAAKAVGQVSQSARFSAE